MAVSVEVLTTVPQPVFTATSSSAITFLSFCNDSSSPVVINMYVVPAGQIVDPSCLVFRYLEIPPYDTYQIYVGNEKLILDGGDSIHADATTGSVIRAVTSYTSL
jgi:hypothetical protein